MKTDTEKLCANCHYSFDFDSWCKCKLNLDSTSSIVIAFMRKQQVVGYRTCLADVLPDAPVLSDDEIREKINANTALLRVEIERIGK